MQLDQTPCRREFLHKCHVGAAGVHTENTKYVVAGWDRVNFFCGLTRISALLSTANCLLARLVCSWATSEDAEWLTLTLG